MKKHSRQRVSEINHPNNLSATTNSRFSWVVYRVEIVFVLVLQALLLLASKALPMTGGFTCGIGTYKKDEKAELCENAVVRLAADFILPLNHIQTLDSTCSVKAFVATGSTESACSQRIGTNTK